MHPRDLKLCVQDISNVFKESRANFSEFCQSLSNILDGT